jgi:hypothetical protein
MECDRADKDMLVAGLPHYLLDTRFARVDVLRRYGFDSPRGLVLPDTFGVDRDTGLRRLGRGKRFTRETALV